jgi:tetratricopeptide (TPR) repeat protein
LRRAARALATACPARLRESAIAACTRAIEAGTLEGHELAKLHYYRAFEYGGKGDNDRAIADHDEAIRIDREYDVAYYGRGNAWSNKGNNDRAIADLVKAIRVKLSAAD